MDFSDIYNPQKIESKWIKIWEEKKLYSLKSSRDNPKYYVLEMFPYPSGEPHMGHARNYTIGDVLARVLARRGYNVLHPIGYDAFGLPAENAAIKSGIHPKDSTMASIEKMKIALKRMGMTYDFEDEIITSDPGYYKWTQWLFLLLFRMDLAEKKEAPVNWCDSCQTVLANEQVIGGMCERCENAVRKRVLSQWFFKITDYAQRLLDDMDIIKDGWPERVLTIQQNWIGRSEGAEVNFRLDDDKQDIIIPIFTTRPDTLYGVTFFILASEHPLVDKIVTDDPFKTEVEKARVIISGQSDVERGSEEIEKIGCFTGRYVINPVNDEKVPIWVANYVLLEYGTGAIMAVPAHDKRDFDFAKKYGIPIKKVISRDEKPDRKLREAYTGEGIMINSGPFNGLPSDRGRREVTAYLEKNAIGKFDINYKLKDWLISRQRYWGAPIPVIYCESCGTVPVPEKDLPVLLPYNVDFKPTGLSPLSYCDEFVNTRCPKCGGAAKRETDTMDTFVCSSWYFLRYCSPHLEKEAFDRDSIKYWMPVDQYIGGIEHATMHLIYSRFFTKALYDSGLIDFKEPFTKYYPHGVVTLGGQKMSKSKGNIVNPSEIYNKFGADTLRLYILFIGPADCLVDWNNKGVEGANRFLKRLWRLVGENIRLLKRLESKAGFNKDFKLEEILKSKFTSGGFKDIEKELYRKLHQAIKKVTIDILERFNFNTAISAVMELVNLIKRYNDSVMEADRDVWLIYELSQKLLILLSPIIPFITEELWDMMGKTGSIHRVAWPSYDKNIARSDMVIIVFQVNGKLRDRIELPQGTSAEELENAALSSQKVRNFIEGRLILKKIVVPDKLVNIVVQS
ncbi:MAG: leucine--tRNA ligase [Actinobacteria bacterium]|nr:leucine--tRNA ligase [Actinomycetota bacterium]